MTGELTELTGAPASGKTQVDHISFQNEIQRPFIGHLPTCMLYGENTTGKTLGCCYTVEPLLMDMLSKGHNKTTSL